MSFNDKRATIMFDGRTGRAYSTPPDEDDTRSMFVHARTGGYWMLSDEPIRSSTIIDGRTGRAYSVPLDEPVRSPTDM